MAKRRSLRLDDDAEQALAQLAANGASPSEAIRIALIEVAARRQEWADIVAEAALVAADPEDRAEMQRVVELIEELRAEA